MNRTLCGILSSHATEHLNSKLRYILELPVFSKLPHIQRELPHIRREKIIPEIEWSWSGSPQKIVHLHFDRFCSRAPASMDVETTLKDCSWCQTPVDQTKLLYFFKNKVNQKYVSFVNHHNPLLGTSSTEQLCRLCRGHITNGYKAVSVWVLFDSV